MTKMVPKSATGNISPSGNPSEAGSAAPKKFVSTANTPSSAMDWIAVYR